MQPSGIKVPKWIAAVIVGLVILTSASHQVNVIAENIEATTTTVLSIAELLKLDD